MTEGTTNKVLIAKNMKDKNTSYRLLYCMAFREHSHSTYCGIPSEAEGKQSKSRCKCRSQQLENGQTYYSSTMNNIISIRLSVTLKSVLAKSATVPPAEWKAFRDEDKFAEEILAHLSIPILEYLSAL